MWNVTIPKHTWIAVCNSARGLILQNDGTPAALNLRTVASYENHAASTHELGSSPPGRATGPHGLPRNAFEAPDLHLRAEQEFIARFAAALDSHAANAPHLRLVVIAPPRVLGWLRKELTPALQRGLFAEIPRDVAGCTVSEIKEKLAASPDSTDQEQA